MPQIKSIVRETVVTAAPNATVPQVTRLMDERGVGSVVVVEDDRPVGIVTDRDVAIRVVARDRDPATLTAEDVMTADPVTVHVDSGVFDVMRAMSEASARRIPAVDDDGRLAGIVTFDDFVDLLGRELRLLADVVEAEAPPYEHT